VELMLAANVAKWRVSDNGSAPEPLLRGGGLAIIGELASSLGGRVYTSWAAEGSGISRSEKEATEWQILLACHLRRSRASGRLAAQFHTGSTQPCSSH